MYDYDKQYQHEVDLFGAPYPEFVEFVREQGRKDGTALDLGCGQGRDALMLARHGYTVTGVDASRVGVEQMLARAHSEDLAVTGVVADIFAYAPPATYDLIVLDSMLHFEKADRAQELALLDRAAQHLRPDGYLCIFIHKAPRKERELQRWLAGNQAGFAVVRQGYIDYTYKEQASGFESSFQFYMLIVQRTA